MAKETPKPKREEEGKKPAGKKRLHLHEIRSTQARDGSIVHHHTYQNSADDHMTMPERGPMATSSSPEDAGQHVAEQFGMNQMGGGGGAPEDPAAAAGPPEGGGEPQAE
jgi:hypothetical protein